MTWSPERSVASEPTIDASAPSARCVWPRMTPGCSSKDRFTRSSNSRIRSICVNIQKSRSLSRPCSDTRSPFGVGDERAGGELRGRRLVRSIEDLLDGEAPQLLGEDLDAPGPVVAHLAADGDVLPDRELALARKPAVVDG